jgi:hypothetical protein
MSKCVCSCGTSYGYNNPQLTGTLEGLDT